VQNDSQWNVNFTMPSYFLEGESFFILSKLDSIIENKKAEINPEKITNTFSLFGTIDYYVFFDPSKETIESINFDNFIVCFMDKNVDLRLDYIKRIKNKSEYHCFDPIPTTDFISLKNLFHEIQTSNFLPTKKVSLKYKGSKQNYEWYDIGLISDILNLEDQNIFEQIGESFFDIWKFSNMLWSGNPKCLEQLSYINDKNFEDYFNRIRETSKYYLEIVQTKATSFSEHKKYMPNTALENEYRFEKTKEQINAISAKNQIYAINSFETCLKNVRLGSSPKLELLKLFFELKRYGSK